VVKKRERLDVIHDILKAVMDAGNALGPTRLLYASNLSPQMFREYIAEMIEKKFLVENKQKGKKSYSLTTKGFAFLEKYKEIVAVIEEFGL
jgi:predicted transcriptional regulator